MKKSLILLVSLLTILSAMSTQAFAQDYNNQSLLPSDKPLKGNVSETGRLPFVGPNYDLNGEVNTQELNGQVGTQQLNDRASLQQKSLQGNTALPYSGRNLNAATNSNNQIDQNHLQPQQPSGERIKPTVPSQPNQLPYSSGFHPSNQPVDQDKPEWFIYVTTADTPCFDPLRQSFITGNKAQIVDFGEYNSHYTSQQLNIWNQWGEHLLHMIYANLNTFPGTRNGSAIITIYIRNDGKIKTDVISNPNTEKAIKESINALYGMPELKFPTFTPKDTIFIRAVVGFGRPTRKLPPDLWGREQPNPTGGLPYQYQYAW